MNRQRALTLTAIIVAITVALDQATKEWALSALGDGTEIDVLPTLQFDLVFNRGFSFGTGQGLGPYVGALVIVLCGLMIQQIFVSNSTSRVVVLATVLGGAIGNLIDRIFRADDGLLSGAVIDFIDVSWWAVFNVADIFVVCGLIVFALFESKAVRAEQNSASAATE